MNNNEELNTKIGETERPDKQALNSRADVKGIFPDESASGEIYLNIGNTDTQPDIQEARENDSEKDISQSSSCSLAVDLDSEPDQEKGFSGAPPTAFS